MFSENLSLWLHFKMKVMFYDEFFKCLIPHMNLDDDDGSDRR